MSTETFEDELRSLLHDAADAEGPAYVDVDLGVVVVRGRRVLRRRRIAMAGGALAAAVVVAAGSWAAVNDGRDRAAPVPATRTTMADVGVVKADVTLDDGGGSAQYTVRLDTSTGEVTATKGDLDPDAPVPLGTVPRTGAVATWATLSTEPFVVVGVVPAAATQTMTRFTGDLGGISSDRSPLPGTPYQAVVWRAERTDPAGSLAGLDWTDGTHVYDTRGAEVPSTRLDDRVLYVDEVADQLGIVEPDGSATIPMQDARDAGLPPVYAAGRGPEGGRMTTTYAILLPAGATDVRADVDPAVNVVEPLRTASLDRVGTVALLRWEGSDAYHGTAVRTVSWRDAEGQHLYSDAGVLEAPGAPGTSFSVDAVTDDGATSVVVRVLRDDGATSSPVSFDARDLGPDGRVRTCLGATPCAVVPQHVDDAALRDAGGTPFLDGSFAQVDIPGTGLTFLAVTSDRAARGGRARELLWVDGTGHSHTVGIP